MTRIADSPRRLWEQILDQNAAEVRRALAAMPPRPRPAPAAMKHRWGIVYYAEQRRGIHAWHADPDHAEAGRELSLFGESGFQADREGIAIYASADGTGFVVCTDQLPSATRYLVFSRAVGERGSAHRAALKVIEGGADSTDGLDATAERLPGFPHGLLVAMNSAGRNLLVYRFEDLGLPATRGLAAPNLTAKKVSVID